MTALSLSFAFAVFFCAGAILSCWADTDFGSAPLNSPRWHGCSGPARCHLPYGYAAFFSFAAPLFSLPWQ